MIWIASFPRSGNTFVRNILFEVYGLSSGEYHLEEEYPLDKHYAENPFVKTHLLPHQLEPSSPDIKSVYLVRDGRDALISMAHQRTDIVAPGSDFHENLKAAIIAEKDTFFGGWSHNASAWMKRADLIIRYEDLIADPIGQIERIREIYELPEPDLSKTPSFEKLKSGQAAYGARKSWGYSKDESEKLADKAFRKGRAGSWKNEMPDEIHDLFWTFHGNTMEQFGYAMSGELSSPDPDFDHTTLQKLGMEPEQTAIKKYRVLLEANKMGTKDNDGVKRYVAGLITGLIPLVDNDNSRWDIDLLINNKIISLKEYAARDEDDFEVERKGNELTIDKNKRKRTLVEKIEAFLQNLISDKWIKWLTDNNILLFHKTYDFLKKTALSIFYWLKSIVLFLPRVIYTQYLKYKEEQELKLISERMSHYDLIHVSLQQHYGPFKYTRVPLLITIHDFTHKLFPKYHTGINIKNAENGLKLIEKKRAHIVAVSKSTLNDSRKFLSLPANNFHFVYESVEEDKFTFQVNVEDRSKVREKYGIHKETPYILLLSTIEPRKNLINSINAFLLLHKKHKGMDLQLVVAGKQGWKMQETIRNSNLIIYTGFVDDKDLSALYTEATALSYISFYEGFGLPLLEAMRCGTPVIYGDNSSMPEVAGDGGLAAKPDDIEDICNKYETLYFNEKLRKDLGRKAMKQSLNFSIRKSTKEMLEVYEKIIIQENQ